MVVAPESIYALGGGGGQENIFVGSENIEPQKEVKCVGLVSSQNLHFLCQIFQNGAPIK